VKKATSTETWREATLYRSIRVIGISDGIMDAARLASLRVFKSSYAMGK